MTSYQNCTKQQVSERSVKVAVFVETTRQETKKRDIQRIKQDPNQYDLFIDMLRCIKGMDITVNSITSS